MELLDQISRPSTPSSAARIGKIKTIGDPNIVVGGLPNTMKDHTERVARAALEMIPALGVSPATWNLPLAARIGIHRGPVVAGVIGRHKFIYDLWGTRSTSPAGWRATDLATASSAPMPYMKPCPRDSCLNRAVRSTSKAKGQCQPGFLPVFSVPQPRLFPCTAGATT